MLASWTVPVMSIVRRWLMDCCLGVDMSAQNRHRNGRWDKWRNEYERRIKKLHAHAKELKNCNTKNKTYTANKIIILPCKV